VKQILCRLGLHREPPRSVCPQDQPAAAVAQVFAVAFAFLLDLIKVPLFRRIKLS
jgi:hypothetical protein